MNADIAGILLAAGKSSRFGGEKLSYVLPASQVPVAVQAASNLLQVLPDSIAVIRKGDKYLKQLLSATGIAITENPQDESGMSGSIRCALQHLDPGNSACTDINGYLIALADMPFIKPGTIQTVVSALQQGQLICRPQLGNKQGHPVGFSSKLYHELLNLQGDTGAKSVIDKHSEHLHLVDVADEGVLQDIDHPDDLTRDKPAR